jgi:hypothetical protein
MGLRQALIRYGDASDGILIRDSANIGPLMITLPCLLSQLPCLLLLYHVMLPLQWKHKRERTDAEAVRVILSESAAHTHPPSVSFSSIFTVFPLIFFLFKYRYPGGVCDNSWIP